MPPGRFLSAEDESSRGLPASHDLVEFLAMSSKQKFSRFLVYWWVGKDGPRLCRYATRSSADIRTPSASIRNVTVYPIDANDGDDALQCILKYSKGAWTVKSDSFEDASEEYEFGCCEDDDGVTWTDVWPNELMVIRGEY